MRAGVLLLRASCRVTSVDVVDDTGDGRGGRDTATDGEDTGDGDTGEAVADCDALTPLPLDRPRPMTGFTNAEDFTFNAAGQHVSVDEQGNLVGITRDGTKQLLFVGAGNAAGIHMLPDATVVYADVTNNTVVNVDPSTGDYRVLAAGLSYPNGRDVGRDGFVYVAETARGGVRRIDPVTGESEVIALGLVAPNGVSFGDDWNELYVGSFGGGVVYRTWREDVSAPWARPEVFSLVPGATAPPDACGEAAEGAVCASSYDGLPGECVASELGITCVTPRSIHPYLSDSARANPVTPTWAARRSARYVSRRPRVGTCSAPPRRPSLYHRVSTTRALRAPCRRAPAAACRTSRGHRSATSRRPTTRSTPIPAWIRSLAPSVGSTTGPTR
jgi:hypothetical protein